MMFITFQVYIWILICSITLTCSFERAGVCQLDTDSLQILRSRLQQGLALNGSF